MEIKKYSICRASTLPREGRLEDYWNQLKVLIGEASSTLLGKINEKSLAELDRRTRLSVERYFNRARFRPIPYGNFCTVGLMPRFLGERERATLSDDITVLRLPDWSRVKGLSRQFGEGELAEHLLWHIQSTLYTANGLHYFFQASEGQTELFSLEGFPELDRLLRFCAQVRSTSELRNFAGEDWDIYSGLLKQLLELQVLVNTNLPNLTGQDYFERLGGVTFVADQLGSDAYAIAFRHARNGFQDGILEKELLSYVAFARKHIPNPPLPDLTNFARDFTKRYENQWQPLSLVLDPSQGLGYGGLSNSVNMDIAALLPKPDVQSSQVVWDEIRRFLLERMMDGVTAIDLKAFVGNELGAAALPNTLSVLVQPAANGEWVIEHIGGPSATTLLGRFSVDEAIGAFTRELAGQEAKANPGVKFFDIAYQTGERTDNINRRPQLYDMELALGGWSTHPCQLQLSDIFINVVGGEVVLYSASHQCRVVPRMASAYNTLRSSHPVLRLMADLQYQGLQHQFLPDLSQYFPGMDHYPALRFGSLMLQPARWKIPSLARKSLAALETWLSQSNVSRYIKFGRADQYLCIDLEQAADRELLWDSLARESGTAYVSQWASGGDKGMADSLGRRFSYQLQLVLEHGDEVYSPVVSFERPNDFGAWEIGGEWLYISLYAAVEHQPLILSELVKPLVSKYHQLIEEWFYILYSDPEKHIRLRIKWKAGLRGDKMAVDGRDWPLVGQLWS